MRHSIPKAARGYHRARSHCRAERTLAGPDPGKPAKALRELTVDGLGELLKRTLDDSKRIVTRLEPLK